MKTFIATTLIVLAFAANQASAQFGIQIGNRQITVGRVPQPSVPVQTTTPRIIATPQGVYATTTGMPQVATPAPNMTNVAYQMLAQNLYGSWFVQANHVNATLELGPGGFSMQTPQIDETGVWDGSPITGQSFNISLQSSLRGLTRFQATWVVPGKQFQMVSLSSGVTYTVTKNPATYSAPSFPVSPVTNVTPVVASQAPVAVPTPAQAPVAPNQTHNGLL